MALTVKEIKQKMSQIGTEINGKNFPVYVFLIGPTYYTSKPMDCGLEVMDLPEKYYTVHLSYGQEQPPIYNSKKYYCRTYETAQRVAQEISDDKGYEIIEIISK